MEKIRIAVCDDESGIRDSIERSVMNLSPDAEVIKFDGGDSLLACEGRFDIIFLDIVMNGMSGMEAARTLRERGSDADIIFVTAAEEYVFEAFDVGAFHYLVKPFDRTKFFEVLNKALTDRKNSSSRRMKDEPCINVKTGAVMTKVFLHEIFYIEVYNRKVSIYKEKDCIEFYGRLSAIEQQLPSDFIRCHRSYIVNMRYVSSYDQTSITLDNGVILPLSKQKHAEFVRRYMTYCCER